jgi:hypothetical protein
MNTDEPVVVEIEEGFVGVHVCVLINQAFFVDPS